MFSHLVEGISRLCLKTLLSLDSFSAIQNQSKQSTKKLVGYIFEKESIDTKQDKINFLTEWDT